MSTSPAPAITDERNKLLPGDKTLLLIEDDTSFAKIVYDFAHKNGFKCLMAADGHTGVSLVDKYKPSAIILDLNLPDMSGTDILARIKDENSPLRRAPVVVLTTTDDKVEIQRCYDLGCNVYITKPVNYENFAQAIRQLGLFLSVIQVPEVEG